MMPPGKLSRLERQTEALRMISAQVAQERQRLADVRKYLTKQRGLVQAKYVVLGEGFGESARVVVRFDGFVADGAEGRLTQIAGTALNALLTAWLDGEFKALEEQEAKLEARDLLAEVAALLAAEVPA